MRNKFEIICKELNITDVRRLSPILDNEFNYNRNEVVMLGYGKYKFHFPITKAYFEFHKNEIISRIKKTNEK